MKFALSGFDMVSDFYGSPHGIKFSIPGSQWFIVPALMSYFASEGFQTYFETLPEVIVRRRANGAPLTVGNLTIEDKPEIVCLDDELIHKMKIKARYEAFEDSICVAYIGDRKQTDICHIENMRFAIPNSTTTSLGLAFKNYYEKECSYYGELREGTTICDVPHREIPQKIMNGQVDYGIMWNSEARHWKFKHYFPDIVKRKFSWLLLENAQSPAVELFQKIQSGVIDRYYSKYGYIIANK